MSLKSNRETSPKEAPVSIYDVFRQSRSENIHPINLTVGNPNLPPPPEYYEAMTEVMTEITSQKWNAHGYVVEEDPFGLCVKIADHLNTRFRSQFDSRDVGITVGATGALDVICKTVLDPDGPCSQMGKGNEVIILAPYFVEYTNIIEANGGVPVAVHTNEKAGLDLEAIEAALGPNTRMMLVNSPNNPTGTIYSAAELSALAQLVSRKEKEFGTTVYLIEDAVYDTIHFAEEPVPSLVDLHPRLFRVNSWSKSMSLSGERIGYFAMHPNIGADANRLALREALFLNMRMRVVHAPLFQHRILARLPVDCVTDIAYYRRNIETLYHCLKELGFGVNPPMGTFYLWSVLPEHFSDEEAFRPLAMSGDNPLLYLPGAIFGGNHYHRCVRFSACVAYEEIERACDKLRHVVSGMNLTTDASNL